MDIGPLYMLLSCFGSTDCEPRGHTSHLPPRPVVRAVEERRIWQHTDICLTSTIKQKVWPDTRRSRNCSFDKTPVEIKSRQVGSRRAENEYLMSQEFKSALKKVGTIKLSAVVKGFVDYILSMFSAMHKKGSN